MPLCFMGLFSGSLIHHLQVKAELKKGSKDGSADLLRLGSALDVDRIRLLGCSSAQEGIDRTLISPRPCPEDRADRAAGRIHDSPNSLCAPGDEPSGTSSLERLPVMLGRQLADDVAAVQPEQATQEGAFRWDLLEQRQADSASAYEDASTAESGTQNFHPCIELQHSQHSPVISI